MVIVLTNGVWKKWRRKLENVVFPVALPIRLTLIFNYVFKWTRD